MKSTDAISTALAAAAGVIDKMELDTTKTTKEDRNFLAEYQTQLGTAPGTSRREDKEFVRIFRNMILKSHEDRY